MRISITGPSGIGKTTLANALGLERQPELGEHVYSVPGSVLSSARTIRMTYAADRLCVAAAGKFYAECTRSQLPLVAELLRTSLDLPTPPTKD